MSAEVSSEEVRIMSALCLAGRAVDGSSSSDIRRLFLRSTVVGSKSASKAASASLAPSGGDEWFVSLSDISSTAFLSPESKR